MEIMSLIASKIARNIFDIIAKERKVRYKDLLQNAELLQINKEAVGSVLDNLKQAELIDSQDAPIKDFETFYVTSKGLTLERELRRYNVTANAL